MKRKITTIIIFLVITLIPLTVAESFTRKVKKPSFFMPNGATETKEEVLPPIETINYKGQPIIQNNEETEKETLSTKENQPDEEIASAVRKYQIEQQKTSSKTTIDTAEINQPKEPKTNTQQSTTKQASITQTQIEPEAQTPPQAQAQNTPQKPQTYEDLFSQIMSDYKKDLSAIGQGQAYNTPRLEKMLADYVNIDRHL